MPEQQTPNPHSPKLDDLSATRTTLVERLGNWEDNNSWQTFYDKYQRLLLNWGRAAGLNETEAREVLQDTVIAVANSMRQGKFEHRGSGSFKAWLYGIARYRILDQFRLRRKVELARPELAAETAEPELERLWESEWAQHRLQIAIASTKEKVSSLQFQIYDLYVLRGWTVEKVRETLSVSRGQIYMAKMRVGSIFRNALSRIEP